MRVAVIGHVEHVTLGRVPAVPRPGDIAHLESPRSFPGGGGGVAFFQLTRSPAEVLLYTAALALEFAALVRFRISEPELRGVFRVRTGVAGVEITRKAYSPGEGHLLCFPAGRSGFNRTSRRTLPLAVT